MTTDESHPEWAIRPEQPNVARMYDYYLGGKDNFASDRDAAEKVIEAFPHVLHLARANRRFLTRAVTLLAERGVRQFLDIGSGLPTQENTHEVAQRVAPDSRVVYVDNDPVVLVHARALLANNRNTAVIEGDLREPDAILGHPEVKDHIDFREPVAVLLLSVLNFVPDDAGTHEIVARLREPLVPGSHLVLSHVHRRRISRNAEDTIRRQYGKTVAGCIVARTAEQIKAFFDGTELLPPGLVPVQDWDPWDEEAEPSEPDLTQTGFIAGVGRIP